MMKTIKQSPAKLGLIILLLIVVFLGIWFVYHNWDRPFGEPLSLGTATEVPLAEPTLTDTPEATETKEVLPTDKPTDVTTPTIEYTPTIETVCGSETSLTILVTGTDGQSYLFGLADSIRVVRFDFLNKKVTVLAFPRDLWVDIPVDPKHGVSHGKLNQAYFYGTEGMGFYDGSGYGSGLLAKTLLDNYGLYIDNYISVNLYAFETIIDAMGGINVYLPEDIYIKYYSQPKLYLSAGTHRLTGEQAEQVVRARIGIGDLGRIKNQTRVLNSLVMQILTPDGITKLPEVIEGLIANTLTDLSPDDISRMVCLAAKIDRKEDIAYQTIITEEEESQIGQWVMDEFQGFKVFALFMDPEVMTQRLADFQRGDWPE